MAEMFPNAAGRSAAAESQDDGKLVDLRSKIELKECYARNADSESINNLFVGDSRLGFKSQEDEQLIIHISFKEFVKVRSIKFIEFNGGTDPELNPSKIHLYVNRENLGFEDWEDFDPTETFHLTAEELKESAEPINLKFVKYQRVKSITLFIEDNQGGDITALGGIKIYGRPVESTNMAEFKKNPQG